MSLLKHVTAAIVMMGTLATGQENAPYEPNPDWENPQNLSQGREAARAFFVPFANKDVKSGNPGLH